MAATHFASSVMRSASRSRTPPMPSSPPSMPNVHFAPRLGAMRRSTCAWDSIRVARLRGQYAEVRSLFLGSARLYDDARCVVGTALAIQEAGHCALDQLDFAGARPLLDDALVQHRRFGNVHDAATTLGLLGRLALNEHRLDEARARSAESLRVFRTLHDLNCGAHAAEIYATVLCAMGEAEAALSHAESAAATYRDLGFAHSLAHALCTLGRVHATLGGLDAARRALFDGLNEQQ